MISHLTNTITFMTNSVGESRHVGHSMTHFKLIYSHAVSSLIVQIHAHMKIFLKTFRILIIQINIYIYIYIYISQIELEMRIES